MQPVRATSSTVIKIGVAGWSYEDWQGVVYPRGLPPGARLPYLASFFDCIEINSSFYALPRPETAARWAAQAEDAAPGFLFTCKLLRDITHKGSDEAAAPFRAAIEPLRAAGRLGAVLAQFPWNFERTTATFDRLRRLADGLAGLPLVLELRHRSFLDGGFPEFLAERGIGLANIDLPATATSLPASAFAFGPAAYFRFHGRNRKAWFDASAGRDRKFDYLYSDTELAPWVAHIRQAAAAAPAVFVIANNHYRGQAPANAIDIAHLLGRAPRAPAPLLAAFPHLRDRAAAGAEPGELPHA
ncbi:MAG TPA: DUF72 domain-containing protein [Planctomycetes bacterium]|nr:DUF72 domain-containing protein [Planctomycetota bacterium]